MDHFIYFKHISSGIFIPKCIKRLLLHISWIFWANWFNCVQDSKREGENPTTYVIIPQHRRHSSAPVVSCATTGGAVYSALPCPPYSSQSEKVSMLGCSWSPTARFEKRAEPFKLLGEVEESRGRRRRRIDITRAALGAQRNSLQVFEPRSIKGSGLSIHFECERLFLLESVARVRSPRCLHWYISWHFPHNWTTRQRDRSASATFWRPPSGEVCFQLHDISVKDLRACQSSSTHRVVWHFELKRGVLKCKSTCMRKLWHKRQGTEEPLR